MTVSAPAAIALAMSPDDVDAAVGDHRDVVAGRDLGDVVDCRHLRHAHPRDDPGRADRARPDAALTASAPASISASAASAVAMLPAINSHVPVGPCVRRTTSSTPRRVAVRGVDDEDVDLGLDERRRALDRVRADADRSAHAQPAVVVLGRVRELDALLDVLDGDQPLETAVGVDDRKLLDPVAVQDRLRLLERRARPAQ